MAAAVDNSHCVSCEKQKNTVKCGGCARDFCLRHMVEHHQELSEQLSHTEDHYNQFTNVLAEKNFEAEEHPLVKQINQWEQESMEKIRHIANEVRCQALMLVRNAVADLNRQQKDLTVKLIRCRKEDDFADKDVQFFDEGLRRLKAILDTSPNHQLNYTPSPFIRIISLIDEGKRNGLSQLKSRKVFVVNGPTSI